MQRADKIGLIVASILVVALAAGAGALYVKRSKTLAEERPADVASVQLTPLAEPTPTVDATLAAKPEQSEEATVPKRPRGTKFGYVAKVGKDGLSLRWDLAELLTGKEADLHAKKQGKVMADKLYYIANATKTTDTYDVSPKCVIELTAEDGSTSTIAPTDLLALYEKNPEHMKSLTWFITEDDDVVTKLQQVVLPPAELE